MDVNVSPIEMLEVVHGEISKISKMLEHEPTTDAAVRLTQLRWRVEEWLNRQKKILIPRYF